MNEFKLDKRIEFITYATEIDEDGFSFNTEKIYYKCWSNVKRLSFKEFYSSKTDNVIFVDSFRVRRCKKLESIDSKKYKIKYNNKLYNIVYINFDNESWIDFKAEVVE